MTDEVFNNSGPLKYTVCAMCGKYYLKRPCSIYKVNYKGRVNNCCSYTCYRNALKVKEAAQLEDKALKRKGC